MGGKRGLGLSRGLSMYSLKPARPKKGDGEKRKGREEKALTIVLEKERNNGMGGNSQIGTLVEK